MYLVLCCNDSLNISPMGQAGGYSNFEKLFMMILKNIPFLNFKVLS